MSKWTDQFEAHAFQAVWINLKESLEKSTIDDETIVTSVSEISRLKKVIGYLDSMIENIDPELVPMSTWDNFNGQATPCLQQIEGYNNNKNFAHITNANNHADNLLTYIRPYMVLPEDAANSVKQASTIYLKSVEEAIDKLHKRTDDLVKEIEENNTEATVFFSEIEKTKNSIDEYEISLFGEAGDAGIQTEISNFQIDIEEKHDKINETYNEILIGSETEDSTKKSILMVKESVIEEQKKIEELLQLASDEVNNLSEFHTKIFGALNENEERTGGLSQELGLRTKQLSDFETIQKTKYEALIEEIQTLLPGATNAGLAVAYKEMKDSFIWPIRISGGIFYITLLLLIGVSSFSVFSITDDGMLIFNQLKEWEAIFKSVAQKIPLYIPILWLTYYSTKRRSEYHRLQQEYAHKEALSKSYSSYKKQLEALDGTDLSMQKEFIMKAIDAITYNASKTLDGKHGEKMPAQEVMDKLIVEVKDLAKNMGEKAKP